MPIKVSSFRGRFLLTSAVLVALVLPAVIYTKHMVNRASEESASLNAGHQSLQLAIDTFEQSLQATESTLYHYTLDLDDSTRLQIINLLTSIKVQSNQLKNHYVASNNKQLSAGLDQLHGYLIDLGIEIQKLLHVLARVETRYPAAPILIHRLQPANAEFIAAVEQAIEEGRGLILEPQQRNILNTFREIRYVWGQQVSSVRAYVANRSGVFGQPKKSMASNAANRKRYASLARKLMNSLMRYKESGLLGFQQAASLNRMVKVADKYERYFQKAAKIYTSDNWRADIALFKNNIRPLFTQVWGTLYQIEGELRGFSEGNVNMLIGVSGSLSNIILLLMMFVGLSILFAYLILEYVIRHPIIEVTKALEAEARGDAYLPNLHSFTTKETDVMLNAFQNMQEQVRSRQTRLESILNNAGEGIITIDDRGIIETFNTAAQQLFGYSSEETLGNPAQDLIKLPESRVHGDFLEFCQSPYGKDHINDTVVSAMHKNGSVFPMSINVSELWVEGRQLFIAIVEDISERVALMDNLRTMAEHDSLTGLYNREYFMTELDRVVENIKRGVRNDFSLLYIDLDNFKFVNDTLGHLAGDQVLVEVTNLLSRRNRKSDLLARIGGDEFALLIYGASRDQVISAAESLRKLLANYVFKYDGKVINIGCSVGVTLFGQEPLIKEDLLVQADIACHIAKRSGRNRIHVYEADDKQNMAAMSEDMGWAARIKNAIDQDLFVIACQPILDTQTKDIQHYEVLLRLRADDGSLILPAGFLPSADRFGLMQAVDRWVIQHAIGILGKSVTKGKSVHFAINLSAKSLEESDTFDIITEALEKCGVQPTSVTFEITENVAIANLSSAVEFLNKLRALGCKTALDDFGVGYSSFAYLKDLPIDYVKIDGSFVRNLQKDMLHLTMVRSMNDIAHAMGLKTVAEYVDSADCLEKLQEIGIDLVQGFYMGKPRVIEQSFNKKTSYDRVKSITA